MIERGKPCAKITVYKKDLTNIEEYIKTFTELNIYQCPSLEGKDCIALWIYKDKFMIKVIKSLPDEPNSMYDHWVLGKAFGYSEESIREFCRD